MPNEVIYVCLQCGTEGCDGTGICPECGPTQVQPKDYYDAAKAVNEAMEDDKK